MKGTPASIYTIDFSKLSLKHYFWDERKVSNNQVQAGILQKYGNKNQYFKVLIHFRLIHCTHNQIEQTFTFTCIVSFRGHIVRSLFQRSPWERMYILNFAMRPSLEMWMLANSCWKVGQKSTVQIRSGHT